MKLSQGVPAVPSSPMTNQDGTPTLTWYTFFVNLWNRTGGATANISPLLDQIVQTPGAILYRAASVWSGLAIGSAYEVLKVIGGFPSWGLLDGNSFGSQGQNSFFVGPSASDGIPSFRDLVTSDLDSVAGAIPGIAAAGLAAAGNVGEVATAATATPVSLTSATIADIVSLSLTAGDWDVWGTLGVNTSSATIIRAWISKTSMTDPNPPNKGAYVLSQPAAALVNNQVFPVGTLTVDLGATANVYLSAQVTFSSATTAYASLVARRRR
jgi:hypothetical protein